MLWVLYIYNNISLYIHVYILTNKYNFESLPRPTSFLHRQPVALLAGTCRETKPKDISLFKIKTASFDKISEKLIFPVVML